MMKKIRVILFLSLILSLFLHAAYGQSINLQQSNASGIYKKGETISVTAFADGMTGDSVNIRVLKNNINVIESKSVKVESEKFLVFEGSFKEPCSIVIEAKTGGVTSGIGLVVKPERLKPGAERPADFKEYWSLQKKNLQALPFDVKTSETTGPDIETGISCVNIEINCLGPKPARGYFAKPAIAAPKSLPIVLLVHAAGVSGSWCRSEPKNALEYAKMGALCFDLNAHGMLNGQPESYYAELDTGELRNYYWQGLTSRDDFYFRGMYLRLLRTLDYLKKQPEWDRKRILVIGESQGGGQALVAAGLDKRVSAVVAIVPAMCDFLGPLSERKGGWPQPFNNESSGADVLQTVPYFDAANILRGSKATIFTEIGLIDMTCPSTSVYAAINEARGKKIIYPVPYRGHQSPRNSMSEIWEETVYKPRELFIRNYLR